MIGTSGPSVSPGSPQPAMLTRPRAVRMMRSSLPDSCTLLKVSSGERIWQYDRLTRAVSMAALSAAATARAASAPAMILSYSSLVT